VKFGCAAQRGSPAMASVTLNERGTAMRYNLLGESGLLVSEVGLGCMTFTDGEGAAFRVERGFDTQLRGGVGVQEALRIMELAYRNGVNFFDNAESYGGGGVSERIMGEAVQLGLSRGLWERADLVISTKLFGGGRGSRDTVNSVGLSRKHLYEGLKASLRRLQLEYVDLVFCHRPDPRTPIEETVRAMNFLLDRGMAFYWGTSEWSALQLQQARQCADKLGLVGPCMEQCQYNMLSRERVEVEYAALSPRLGLTTWSPLASGVLTGKYAEQVPQQSRQAYGLRFALPAARSRAEAALRDTSAVVGRLAPVARELGCTLAQLAIAWCLTNEHVSSVVVGVTTLEQLQDNLGAVEVAGKLRESPELGRRIEAMLGNKPKVDFYTRVVGERRGSTSRL